MVSVAFNHKARFKLDGDSLSIGGIKYDSNNSGIYYLFIRGIT